MSDDAKKTLKNKHMTDWKTIERKNEELNGQSVTINDNVILRHIGKEIIRVIGINNNENKAYYFMTDTLDPRSVYCNVSKKISQNKKEYMVYNFSLKGNVIKNKDNMANDKEFDDKGVNQDPDKNTNTDIIIKDLIVDTESCIASDIVPDTVPVTVPESQRIIDRLNAFKRQITDRIRYLMMIPQYPDQISYILTLNTIKLNNHIKFTNIIEFQQQKNNFGFRAVSNVLTSCRYKLLLKIESITLTHSNVFLNIRLVRIYPESLDTLDINDKLHIIGELNALSAKNINTYINLNKFTRKKVNSKEQVKSELLKILSI